MAEVPENKLLGIHMKVYRDTERDTERKYNLQIINIFSNI